MTTETERRVPEHPGWQPWWVRYAEYEGVRVALGDTTLMPSRGTCDWPRRYAVGTAPHGKAACVACTIVHADEGESFDSLADAEAAFAEACERLREGM